jgi:hypothetical protein
VSTTIDSAYSPLAALPSHARTFTGSTSSASNHASPEASGRLVEQAIVISADAMARLKAFQSLQPAGTGAGAGGLIGRAPALTRAALGLSSQARDIDLSRHQPLVSMAVPHWNDVSSLLAIPGLGAEKSHRLSAALAQATVIDQQVSNDPAVDIAVRKMKLDYIRDNLMPEAFRAQAEAAISAYISHQVADLDQLSSIVTQHGLEVARASAHTAQAQSLEQELSAQRQGNAPSQQYLGRMLGATRNRQYSSPAQADLNSRQAIDGMKSLMLETIARWPRDQQNGISAVDSQVARIEQDWSSFVASLR